MTRKKRESVWLFWVVLAVLFGLAFLAPRSWREVARSRPAEETARELALAEKDRAAQASQPVSAVAALPAAREADQTASSVLANGPPVRPATMGPAIVAPATGGWVAAEPNAKVANHPLASIELLPRPTEVAAAEKPSQPAGQMASSPRPTLAPVRVAARTPEPKKVASVWRQPEQLFVQLAELSRWPRTSNWSSRTDRAVRELGEAFTDQPGRAKTVCGELSGLVREAEPLAVRLKTSPETIPLRRAAYALQRRLVVWQAMLTLDEKTSPPGEPKLEPSRAVASGALRDESRLRGSLAELNALTTGTAEGQAWRDYLLLDELEHQIAKSPAERDAMLERRLARRILLRVAQAPMDESQESFVRSEPMTALGWELRRMAVSPLDRAALLESLERYERTRLASDGRRLADASLWLGIASENASRAVHDELTTHYRNANLRITLAEDLMNRLTPDRLPEYAPVRDTILGNPVRGERLSESKVAVRLIPDPSRLRLALEVTGEVASLTSSTSGPATFRNASQSNYVAVKSIEITSNGLKLWPAEVEHVDNVTQLRSLETDFDAIPLLGSLVKSVARDQHDKKRPLFLREVRQKVAAQAKRQIDEEADARLQEASEQLANNVFRPLDRLALGPTLLEASTSQQRLTMRVRLAAHQQLGAHTPRPRAPSDSLASVQVHQSAMNNMLERLELDGQTFTVPKLQARIAQRLGRTLPVADEEETEREAGVGRAKTADEDEVEIMFAARDAVRVECQDGRIALNVAIAELSTATQSWEDFEVRVFYKPVVEGLSARLVRDGPIQLHGPYLRAGSQVLLRGVLTRVFLKNRARQIIPKRLRTEPKMADVVLTQLTIDDGWIALALGPKPRVAAGPKKVR